MSKINLIYMYNKYQIKCNENDLVRNILIKYSSKLNKDIKELYFLYKGKILSLSNNFKIYKLKINNNIYVFNLNIKKSEENKEIENILCSGMPKFINYK